MVPGLFLNILKRVLSSEGQSLSLLPDLGKMVTHLNNLYLQASFRVPVLFNDAAETLTDALMSSPVSLYS